MDNLWLPTGRHWGLTITHEERPDAGPFIVSQPKTLWHTTEGVSFSGALSTLTSNGDEPHCLISDDATRVVQFIPFNRASKSLKHPFGTPETNLAHCIQIEVCGFAVHSHAWTDTKMRGLASLAALIEHRCGVERATHVSWVNPRRVRADRFAGIRGHLGHVHAPNNDHVDPGRFRIHDLFEFMAEAEKKYQ